MTDLTQVLPAPSFNSIEEIKEANANAGYHFFSKDTLRFFSSRILTGVFGGHYFVTSERCRWDDSPRRYSLRGCHANGKVSTYGKFQKFETASQAKAAARALAKFPALTYEQGAALYYLSLKDSARELLRRSWDTGASLVLEGRPGVNLYCLRNTHGPAWLATLDRLGIGLGELS